MEEEIKVGILFCLQNLVKDQEISQVCFRDINVHNKRSKRAGEQRNL